MDDDEVESFLICLLEEEDGHAENSNSRKMAKRPVSDFILIFSATSASHSF